MKVRKKDTKWKGDPLEPDFALSEGIEKLGPRNWKQILGKERKE